jgi:hypothetical protein
MAATSALVKATLLAGAERVTHNLPTTIANIVDYRSDVSYRTESGLDSRYGAGQLNIYNSYHILAGGEFNSWEDDYAEGVAEEDCGLIGNAGFGFDADAFFGGQGGSNSQARYYFTAQAEHRRLYASLVWHLSVDGGDVDNWDGTATLYDLDLFLYDITNPNLPVLVAVSENRVENTENLWAPLVPGRDYIMEVVSAPGQEDFEWDYSLAWRMVTPPDSDSDGIPDDWEVQFGLDYQDSADASEDNDGDGLDNEAEYEAGTDISLSDTDGDGVSDRIERNFGTDPLDMESLPELTSVPAIGMLSLAALFGFFLWLIKNGKII